MNDPRMLIRTKQIRQIKRDTEYKKIVYFGTHIGWGKTTTVLQYLDTNKLTYEYVSAKDEDFFVKIQNAINKNAENIVIDDVHLIVEYGEKLTEIIAESYHTTKFFVIGRSALPSYLKAFYTTRQLIIYDNSFFALSENELNEMIGIYGMSLTKNTAAQILSFTGGWILGVIFVFQHIKDGEFDESVKSMVILDMFEYFDHSLFDNFSERVQKFLLNMGHLPHFTRLEATMICGENDIEEVIDEVRSVGSFLSYTPPDEYEFQHLFQLYLAWKQRKECKREYIKRRYESTALYFALQKDVPNALKYYSLAENHEAVSEILIKNADNHAGNGYFYEVREYYFSLPEELVARSVELMGALSIIYSLVCKPEESEHYYNMIVEYDNRLPHGDKKKKQAEEKIAYLNIALPHRGIKSLIDIFKSFSALISTKKINLQIMSITGNMPSLMNGGKDFCEWSKKDKFLYNTIRKPVCLVLGRSSDGLPEIGLAESQFEKNYDGNLTGELMLLNTGYSMCEISGNIQLRFAAIAVMARIYVTQGKSDEAVSIIQKFRSNVRDNRYILKNVDAFLVYLSMMSGDTQMANNWFCEDAPDEYKDFFIMERYRYLVKIRIYIMKEMYMEALSLISRLENYFLGYERKYCYMESSILKAIILYRTGDKDWEKVFNDALAICEEYQFIRIVSKFGIGVLDMLRTAHPKIGAEYKNRLLESTKKQAILYPKFMKTEKKKNYSLTDTEKTVLKLICDGLTNEEISNLMEITERTVKFHLSNIYGKLEVKNRVGAVNIANDEQLI